MSPLEILARQLDQPTVNRLGQQLGAPPQQTQAATAGIVQTLLGAMARNVEQDPGQAQRIERALDRDNHAALLDNLNAVLGASGSSHAAGIFGNGRALNGMGILQHILGNRTGRVADQVSKSSGLSTAQVGQLMIMLAPIIMGALGKARQSQPQQGQGGGGIADILNSVLGGGGMFGGPQPAPQQAGTSKRFLDAILDRNGDGNSSDELVQMGTQLLGGMFGR